MQTLRSSLAGMALLPVVLWGLGCDSGAAAPRGDGAAGGTAAGGTIGLGGDALGAAGTTGVDAQGTGGTAGPDAGIAAGSAGTEGQDASSPMVDATGPDSRDGQGADRETSDGGGADNSGATYNPCPASGPCAVMPLGDSITAGYKSTDGAGYRKQLFHLAHAAGKNITFVGGEQGGPNTVDGVPFPRANEGHSGYTIKNGGGRSGIYELTANAIRTKKPDIVTLMIGTNDMGNQADLPNAPGRLGDLLDLISATDPRVLVVLAQIVPIPSDDAHVKAYNAAMPALVKARADAGKHVILVDAYSAFANVANYKTTLMADGLHPNDAGYAVLGGVWYATVGPLLH